MRLALLLPLLLLAACKRDDVKPDLPPSCPTASAEVRVVTRTVYVSVPSRLTLQEEIAEGPLSECPAVAAERRAAIERLNSRAAETRQIQGTEVKP